MLIALRLLRRLGVNDLRRGRRRVFALRAGLRRRAATRLLPLLADPRRLGPRRLSASRFARLLIRLRLRGLLARLSLARFSFARLLLARLARRRLALTRLRLAGRQPCARRLREQVGHTGHPALGDVGERLDVFGQLLERGRLELRVLECLADEVGPFIHEAVEPAGIRLFGRGLGLEPRPALGREQLLGGQLPQLLVGGEQAHLAIADLARLLAKLLEPGVEHQRVLGPIDHVEHQWRRNRAAAARQVVLGEGPDGDRLRANAQGVGAERGRRVERLHLAAARL